jgi:hypothetical protein
VCFGHQFDADLFVDAVGRMIAPASEDTPAPQLNGRVVQEPNEERNE